MRLRTMADLSWLMRPRVGPGFRHPLSSWPMAQTPLRHHGRLVAVKAALPSRWANSAKAAKSIGSGQDSRPDASSSREPVSTSLENALIVLPFHALQQVRPAHHDTGFPRDDDVLVLQ